MSATGERNRIDTEVLSIRTCRERGVDFICTRRLAELLGATTLNTFAALTELLATSRPD